jgi:hypothetical protein
MTEQGSPQARAALRRGAFAGAALVAMLAVIVALPSLRRPAPAQAAAPATSTVVITTPEAFTWAAVSINGQPAGWAPLGSKTLLVADLRSVALVDVAAEGVEADASCAITIDGVTVSRNSTVGAGVPALCSWTRPQG